MRAALHIKRHGSKPFSLATYLGQIASRSFFPNSISGSNNSIMSRTAHICLQATSTAPQVGFPGCYTASTGIDTITTATNLTYTASIEYPAGTFTQVKWAAAASKTTSVVIPDSPSLTWTGLSDTGITLGTPIPLGAIFWIRNFVVTPGATGAGVVSTLGSSNTQWVAQGEAAVFAAGAGTDLTMSGTVTHGGTNAFVYPLCVVQNTTNASFGLVGDSRTLSTTSSGTIVDANGNAGQLSPSLGASFAYINVAINATKLAQFNTSGSARFYFANTFCSHIINGHGINDVDAAGARTALQLEGDFFITGKRFFTKTLVACTLSPATTGTFTTTGGQTPDGNAAGRQTFNTWVRGTPAPYKSFVDISLETQDAVATDVWQANATADGLHAVGGNSSLGYGLIVSSGILNAQAISLSAPLPQFSPFQLRVANLPVWVDFANSATAPTTPVTPMNAAGSRMQFSAANTPTYGATSFNGGPGYVFNGTTSNMIGDVNMKAITNGAAGVTFAAMMSLTSNPAASRSWWGATVNGSNNERAYLTVDSTGHPGIAFRRLDADAATTAISATAMTLGSPTLLVGVFDPTGGTATLYVNGVSVATGNFLSTGSFSATASNNVAFCTLNSLFTAITAREIQMFDSALSTANRQKIEGDLAWRSGLASTLLPGNHPYFNAPPTA